MKKENLDKKEQLIRLKEEIQRKELARVLAQRYDEGMTLEELALLSHFSVEKIKKLIGPYSTRYNQVAYKGNFIPNNTLLGYEHLDHSLKIYYYDGSVKEMFGSKRELQTLEKELLKEAILQIQALVKRKHNKLTEKETMYFNRWEKDFLPCLDLLEEVGGSIWNIKEFDLLKMNQSNFYEYNKYMEKVKLEVRDFYRGKKY